MKRGKTQRKLRMNPIELYNKEKFSINFKELKGGGISAKKLGKPWGGKNSLPNPLFIAFKFKKE